ncbi:DUF599 domain-containing protein [Aliiroseovarius sp.]|uniref:DUF599 domain-containing protein n=1 Tax=Aliiroseovarius sp. TaxID=1872442 RepID=UPI003BAA67CC
MQVLDQLAPFSPLDALAVCALLLGWLIIGWRIENPSPRRVSTSRLVAQYRHDWMKQMVTRQPRVFDSSILSNMRQGTSFFASASMIGIGGGMALLGNTERLSGVAADLAQAEAPVLVWEVRILLVIGFLTHAFLSFVWSHRLFGYCAVVMASVPNDPEDAQALPRARQAGALSNTAARSFNRGLRSVYFAIAALAWFAGPIALIGATLITLFVLWRREFASRSREVLLEDVG